MTQNVYIDEVTGHEMRCTLRKGEGLVEFEFLMDGHQTSLHFGSEDIQELRKELEKLYHELMPF